MAYRVSDLSIEWLGQTIEEGTYESNMVNVMKGILVEWWVNKRYLITINVDIYVLVWFHPVTRLWNNFYFI